MTQWQSLWRHNTFQNGLALTLGLAFGVMLGAQYVQDQTPALVLPRSTSGVSVRELQARLQIPDLQQHVESLQQKSPWQLAPDGREPAPTAAAPVATPQLQRWLLVGRVQRPDGAALILFQPEMQQSKSFGLGEALPDGRILVAVDEASFELRAAKGRKRERIAFGSGLDIIEAQTTSPANPGKT